MDTGMGKLLIVIGVGIAVMGLLIVLGGRLGLGRLPGDIVVRGERTTIYFPIVTCLLLSLALTLVMWVIQAFRK
jgi:hypothetical protein